MPTPVSQCRICGHRNLVTVLDLGDQALTGVFPRSRDQVVTTGPLQLVKCHPVGDEAVCGLVQLAHTYEAGEMYGNNYGYRSGLNPGMVRHLQGKVAKLRERVEFAPGDLVVDIGSNDSTTLQAYPPNQYRLVGIDPTGVKFKQYYPPHVELIPDFFSLQKFREHLGDAKAKVVTSFSMFYDLEDPAAFMREVGEVLHPQGVWVFEQSYMPTMLERVSYDTVCHEHLEYYGLRQIKWMTDRSGLRIVDVEFNDVNGGSFSVMAAKTDSDLPTFANLGALLEHEEKLGLAGLTPYQTFAENVAKSRAELLAFLRQAKREGKRVAALGASTKGNVVLQFCNVDAGLVACVGEVNEDKFGSFTPGTLLPIVPENQLLAERPDYLWVLPWHFREHFVTSPKYRDVNLLFSLPQLEIVKAGVNV